MENCELKGLQLAAKAKVSKAYTDWIVSSQSNRNNKCVVNLDEQICTCPDSEFRQKNCKHIYAVDYTLV